MLRWCPEMLRWCPEMQFRRTEGWSQFKYSIQFHPGHTQREGWDEVFLCDATNAMQSNTIQCLRNAMIQWCKIHSLMLDPFQLPWCWVRFTFSLHSKRIQGAPCNIWPWDLKKIIKDEIHCSLPRGKLLPNYLVHLFNRTRNFRKILVRF